MPVAALAIVGALVGLLHIRASARLLAPVRNETKERSSKFPVWVIVFAMVLGSLTAMLMLQVDSVPKAVVITLVTSLTLLQAPLDLATRRLSRPVTLATFAILTGVVIVDEFTSNQGDDLLSIALASLLVVLIFAALHWRSPGSLGWGDVLIAAPLSVSVASVSVEHVAWWQLMSATSGAVHAMWLRLRRGQGSIPFGPHLLLSAWLVLVVSV